MNQRINLIISDQNFKRKDMNLNIEWNSLMTLSEKLQKGEDEISQMLHKLSQPLILLSQFLVDSR